MVEIDIQQLKSRGLTCSKLKSMEKAERKDAKSFRGVGFQNIARVQEESANKIKSLRTKVCKLKWYLQLNQGG